MPWGNDSFHLDNDPFGNNHSLNRRVLGAGKCYDKPSDVKIRFRLPLGVCPSDLDYDWATPAMRYGLDPTPLIHNANALSVLNGNTAVFLGLDCPKRQSNDPVSDRNGCAFWEHYDLGDAGAREGWWTEYDISLELGTNVAGVSVLVPLVCWRGLDGPFFAPDTDFICDNQFSVPDILHHRMLCFTPQNLYVFARH